MIQANVIQIKTSVNKWLANGSFLEHLAFVYKTKTQVFLLGLIDVCNRAENELDFKLKPAVDFLAGRGLENFIIIPLYNFIL